MSLFPCRLRLNLLGMHHMMLELKISLLQHSAAIEELKPYPAQPEALRLAGKGFFLLGGFKKAAQSLQKLVRINPLSSIDF